MKTKLIILIVLSAVARQVHGQMAVVDGAAIHQRERNHLQDLAKYVEMIENQVRQFTTLTQQLAQLEFLSKVIGDPSSITDLAGLGQLLYNLDNANVSLSRSQLLTGLAGRDALLYDGGGLFPVIGDSFRTLDGKTVLREDTPYKPHEAVIRAVVNHDVVFEDVMTRRQTLREGMRSTIDQLTMATTDAETQKLRGVLQGQLAELEASDDELLFAAQLPVVQEIENRNAREMQEKADQDQRAEEYSAAFSKLGRFLRPDTKPRRLSPSGK